MHFFISNVIQLTHNPFAVSFSWLGLRAKRSSQDDLFTFWAQNLSRTIIYIDGYNLYYSRLKGTPYKWLDVGMLFRDQILKPQDPSANVVCIKYFTSPVKASYARHGTASAHAQTQYHRALKSIHGDLIQIIQGFHIFVTTNMPAYVEGVEPDKQNISPVWRIEEKQTDVNLGLQVYRDAVRDQCDQQVICTNDSDLEPALQLVRQDAPSVQIGLVVPLRVNGLPGGAVSNKRLTKRVHWVRQHILDAELESSQLPNNVNTNKKPAQKPDHW